MTTKAISTSIDQGYTLSSAYPVLYLTPTAFIGGSGLLAPQPATILSRGTIEGALWGVDVAGASSTLSNQGLIEGYTGVDFAAGASLVTSGTIDGTGTNGAGIDLAAGGMLTVNHGLVEGAQGIEATGTASLTVMSSGDITGTDGAGIDAADALGVSVDNWAGGEVAGSGDGMLFGSGTLFNGGSVIGEGSSAGVVWLDGGLVTNHTGGLISGGSGILVGGGAGTIVNSARIIGTYDQPSGYGVFLGAGGTVVNEAGGIIEGYAGLVFGPGSGADTLVNGGTIGGSAEAVNFAAGPDVVKIYAGAVFLGVVAGYAASAASNTIALYGGTAAKPGKMSGLGTSYQFFGTVEVAAGADWRLAGTSTLATGYLLDGAGTLAIGGTFIDEGTLSIASGGVCDLASAATTFELAAGADVTGILAGAGGTLALAAPAGTLAGIGGTASVSGAGSGAFSDFGRYVVDAAASWTLAGTNTIAAGQNLTDDGTLAVAGTLDEAAGADIVVGSGGALLLGGTESLEGQLRGAGALALTGGTATLSEGAVVTVAEWRIAGNALLTLSTGLQYEGAFALDAGMLSLGTSYLNLTGSVAFAGGTVDGTAGFATAGTIALSSLVLGRGERWSNSGTVTATGATTLGDASGTAAALVVNAASGIFDFAADFGIALAAGGSGTFVNAGLLEKTAGTGTSVIAASVTDTGTVTVSSGTLEFAGASNLFSGRIGGTGTVAFGAGMNMLETGASLAVASLALSGTGTLVELAESLTFAGDLSEASGATLALGTSTLTLTGTVTLDGSVGGSGTLAVAGGSVAIGSGGAIAVADWSQSGGTITFGEPLTYAGDLTQSKGALSVAQGATLTLAGNDSFAGRLEGAGTLVLAGGADTLEAGAVIAVAGWTIGGNAQLIATASFGYAGTLVLGSATLSLGTSYLNLTGSVTFAGGTVDGTGGFATKGATALSGLALGSGERWNNSGTVTATGATTLGDASGTAAVLIVNAAGGTFDFAADVGIALAAGGSGTFQNAGLLEKTAGTGASVIAASVDNNGTISVDSGTLELVGAVLGTGSDTIGAAGALVFAGAVAGGQTVAFGADSGTLVIDEVLDGHFSFAAPILGFVAGDVIDLPTLADSTATRVTWAQVSATQGLLTVSDGTIAVVLRLVGSYSNARVVAGADRQGGTEITLSAAAERASAGADAAGAASARLLPHRRDSRLPLSGVAPRDVLAELNRISAAAAPSVFRLNDVAAAGFASGWPLDGLERGGWTPAWPVGVPHLPWA